ncbi:MAG: caspase family protein [Alphaproteobacteria bacterium]|nr:caspase family protein [Alphaproteobacteria bacterium]
MPFNADPRELESTSLSYERLKGALSRIAGRVYFFVDTCKSGAIWGRPGEPSTDVNRLVNDLKSPEHGVVVFASSTNQQLSLENQAWGNGALTKAVVEGLRGRADLLRNGRVTVNTLDTYVSDRVATLTEGRQTPATGKPLIKDFVLAILPDQESG